MQSRTRRFWMIFALCVLIVVAVAGAVSVLTVDRVGQVATQGPAPPNVTARPVSGVPTPGATPPRESSIAFGGDVRESQRPSVVAKKGPTSSPQGPIDVPAPPATQATTAASTPPVPMDDAAVEAEIAKRAKPATVKFEVETKMAMGQIYEAKLEIQRPGGGKPSLITGTPEIIEQVQILNKTRATISSAHLKIERLLPEWQEIPTGARGFWTWKVVPERPGKTQLLVLVEHAGTFGNKEHVVNVEQFPRTIEIEVGFWQSVQEAITGLSPSITAAGGIVAALAGIAGAVAGTWAWLRNRRRGRNNDDSHGVATT